ncbi:hypothetical protein EJ05DRAFT_490206 [Pseudovirgaria hyperparasitica]|uniref:Uncharacterized protein n=1 Tax=Pseudovirgaria hyperparasitica TaxID=470096 RepID=A0A6A6VSF2_9PEZI|nr:uncharacterized protein EJ05DRAFT_490206 [Pseudovirgaria hyperparasitica]KAF2753522.1 hypothetical protein EJ05DRAFT_490206 [Pseudovirgaria hyperparasitica]
MEYYDFKDTETHWSLSSASTSSPVLADQVSTVDFSDYLKVPGEDLYIRPASRISTPRAADTLSSPESNSDNPAPLQPKRQSQHPPHQTRSSSSPSPSWFNHLRPKAYLPLPTPSNMTGATPVSRFPTSRQAIYPPNPDIPTFPKTQSEVDQLVHSLRTHRVNTLVELRRIEKVFASLSGHAAADVGQSMTAAWSHYVNSHALLSELRAITKNYPFSSAAIEDAKRRVYADPQSNRSWNFCWLVLHKIQADQLVPLYAHAQAADPAMWGGGSNVVPEPEHVQRLAAAFMAEWNWAVSSLLRCWDRAPVR